MSKSAGFKNSIILKMVAIAFLVLVLLIPTTMIGGLISEREQRRDDAIQEVGDKWGGSQTLAGPILTIPYKKIVGVATEKGQPPKTVEEIHYAHFMPEKLAVKGKIDPQILRRGIYKIIVYNSQLQFSGQFLPPDFKNLNINDQDVIWSDAILSFGISDLRGIKENIKINWDKKVLNPNSGLNNLDLPGDNSYIQTGVNTKVFLSSTTTLGKVYPFSFDLNLNGNKELYFLPVGNETAVDLVSGWNNPSFDGAFLPDSREVNQNGFKAAWKVLQLNRSFSSSWTSESSNNLSNSAFGVKLLFPVDEYQKNMRSIKYAILVIALTFLIFFFIEVMNKIRIHPIQYILVGLALVLFFSLLLSLSEYLNFNLAYLLASAATILMITLYTKALFKNNKLSFLSAGFLILIYSFIFTILQLQDYSLLIGSIGLFAVLAAVMFISRKINWYEIGARDISDKK